MAKVEQILEQLPNLDCGMCGCPTCRCMAEDMVRYDLPCKCMNLPDDRKPEVSVP